MQEASGFRVKERALIYRTAVKQRKKRKCARREKDRGSLKDYSGEKKVINKCLLLFKR